MIVKYNPAFGSGDPPYKQAHEVIYYVGGDLGLPHVKSLLLPSCIMSINKWYLLVKLHFQASCIVTLQLSHPHSSAFVLLSKCHVRQRQKSY